MKAHGSRTVMFAMMRATAAKASFRPGPASVEQTGVMTSGQGVGRKESHAASSALHVQLLRQPTPYSFPPPP